MNENLNQQMVFKELYDVALKATYPIEVRDRTFETGETIAVFDKIRLGSFDENKVFSAASGGYDNRSLVWWEETKEIRIQLSQGVYSKTHFALMTNAAVHDRVTEKLLLNQRETVESNDDGVINAKYSIKQPLFVYNSKTGEKIKQYTIENDKVYGIDPYTSVVLDYYYEYDNGYSVIYAGRALTNGCFSLIGKTRVKDDITGQVKTGIISIPKLKLMSDLSMRLGEDAIPVLGKLDAIALPSGVKGSKQVMNIIFLNDDVDSDID